MPRIILIFFCYDYFNYVKLCYCVMTLWYHELQNQLSEMSQAASSILITISCYSIQPKAFITKPTIE